MEGLNLDEMRRLHREMNAHECWCRMPALLAEVKRLRELYEEASSCANRQTTALLAARARVAELEAALRPLYEAAVGAEPDTQLTVEHLNRAARALEEINDQEEDD